MQTGAVQFVRKFKIRLHLPPSLFWESRYIRYSHVCRSKKGYHEGIYAVESNTGGGVILAALIANPSWGEQISISKVQKTFPHSLPGQTVTIEKVYDPVTQRQSIRTNQTSIQSPEDLVALETAEYQAIRKETGALAPALHEKLQALGDQDEVLVVVSLKQPEGIVYPSKFDFPEAELKRFSLGISALKPVHSLETVLGRYSGKRKTWDGAFSGIVSVSKATLKVMAFDSDIASISEYVTPHSSNSKIWPLSLGALFGQASINLRTLARSAYSHSQTALPANLANGVHAATFESGLTTKYLSGSCLNTSPAFWDPMQVPFRTPTYTNDLKDSIHSLVTFTNLVNAAPGATFYHHFSWDYSGSADSAFIVSNSIRSVSLSVSGFDFSPTDPNNLVVDDFAYRSPYPVFSDVTGNNGWSLQPHWENYNGINVGNVQDSAYVHFKVDTISCGGGATQTRNPPPINGGCIDGGVPPNCAGDREMPYLVAPGYTPLSNISIPPITPTNPCRELPGTTYMFTTCINEGQSYGTSMSAPTVNGMAASLIGQNPYLSGNPEIVRAILLNTARNVHGAEWNTGQDGKDGAGVIHGQNAIAFATNLPNVRPENTAAIKAYYYGALYQTDFNGTSLYFNVAIPSSKPAGQHLRVVLTWDSFPGLNSSQNLLPDIDLWVYASNGSHRSTSWDANIEIVDFTAGETAAGTTARIQVVPATWRRPSDARVNATLVALTWGFVADHAH